METLAEGVWRILTASDEQTLLVAYNGSNRGLVRWLPVASWYIFRSLLKKETGFVLIGDAATHAFLYPILRLFRVPHATMVHGLDLAYSKSVYKALVQRTLKRAPVVIANSEATAESARDIGIPAARICVVRPGIPVPTFTLDMKASARSSLISSMGIEPDSILLLSLGRLVRRKGVRWFVENVLPSTDDNVHYLIAGSGGEAEHITHAAQKTGLGHRVHMLGQVSDETRDRLMYGCDLMVQPNIRVPNDIEGFGLVIIEATLRGTVVLASDLQGIKDAVVDNGTGFLVAPEDIDGWCQVVGELTSDPTALGSLGESFRLSAIDLYSEERMGRELLATIDRARQ